MSKRLSLAQMARTKQVTYQYMTSDDDQKKAAAKSGLAIIRDYRRGWFDVPHSFKKEFERMFGVKLCIEQSCCPLLVFFRRNQSKKYRRNVILW